MTAASPKNLALSIRRSVLRMTSSGQASHVGSCLSVTDILAVLYGSIMNFRPSEPGWPDRDRLIVSKGHAAAAVYSTLAEIGFFPKDWLDTYSGEGSLLIGHVSHTVPGVELSTGSLGHGLPVGAGLALTAKRYDKHWRSYVVLSDGEMDEGSNWEAALFAAHHGLGNLVAIIDYNKLQGFGTTHNVLNLDPLADKWTSFGWHAIEIDGNDVEALGNTLTKFDTSDDVPKVIVAHTLKGKGVSFMENKLEWHYKTPNPDQLKKALAELGETE